MSSLQDRMFYDLEFCFNEFLKAREIIKNQQDIQNAEFKTLELKEFQKEPFICKMVDKNNNSIMIEFSEYGNAHFYIDGCFFMMLENYIGNPNLFARYSIFKLGSNVLCSGDILTKNIIGHIEKLKSY